MTNGYDNSADRRRRLWKKYVESIKQHTTHVQPENFDYSINISLKYRYMYVETPKVACSSIKTTLQRLELEDPGYFWDSNKDVHNRYFSPLLRPSQVGNFVNFLNKSNIYKFCFIRNPYTRLLSGYLDKIVGNQSPKRQILMLLGHDYLDIEKEISFSDFVKVIVSQPISQMDPHWRPQYYQTFHDSIRYDFVGKFEQFDKDFETVVTRIGGKYSEYSSVEQRHSTNSAVKLAEYFSNDVADLVYRKYSIDFEHFGYNCKLLGV